MDLKELLGEELYEQVTEKAGDKKIAVVSDGNWFPKQKFDEVNVENRTLKSQLEERDTQLVELGDKATGNTELQATIDALKQANEQAKSVYQEELNKTRLNYEATQAMLLNGAKNPLAVKALIDMDGVKLNEEGHLEGFNEKLEAVKQSDPYLFTDGTTPPPAGHTPGAHQRHNTPPKADGYQVGAAMYEKLKENKRI